MHVQPRFNRVVATRFAFQELRAHFFERALDTSFTCESPQAPANSCVGTVLPSTSTAKNCVVTKGIKTLTTSLFRNLARGICIPHLTRPCSHDWQTNTPTNRMVKL
jgi:hypothetical protein